MSQDISASLGSFRYPILNLDVPFCVTHGTVVADKIWSQTHVASFGGGGYIHQGTGYINAPTVTSFASTNREIWLRTQNGIETSIRAGENMKVNTGNDVSVIYSGQQQNRIAIALVNRTTRYWHEVQASFESIFLQYYRVPVSKNTGCLSYFLYLLSIGILVTLTHGNEMANHLNREIIDYLFTVSSHLSAKNHVTLDVLLFRYGSSNFNYVFGVEYLVLAAAALNIIFRLKSMLKSKLARKRAAVGSKAFREHCETMCQSMF